MIHPQVQMVIDAAKRAAPTGWVIVGTSRIRHDSPVGCRCPLEVAFNATPDGGWRNRFDGLSEENQGLVLSAADACLAELDLRLHKHPEQAWRIRAVMEVREAMMNAFGL